MQPHHGGNRKWHWSRASTYPFWLCLLSCRLPIPSPLFFNLSYMCRYIGITVSPCRPPNLPFPFPLSTMLQDMRGKRGKESVSGAHVEGERKAAPHILKSESVGLEIIRNLRSLPAWLYYPLG